MNFDSFLKAVLFAAAAVSCSVPDGGDGHTDPTAPIEKSVVLVAQDTRAALDGNHFFYSDGDLLAAWDFTNSAKTTFTVSSTGDEATIAKGMVAGNSEKCFLIYPESGFVSASGNVLNLDFPSSQTHGSYAGALPAVGEIVDDECRMSNLFSVLRFEVSDGFDFSGITSIVLESFESGALAGGFCVDVADLNITPIGNAGSSSVTLLSSEAGFAAGTFDICLIPTDLSDAFRIRFVSQAKEWVYSAAFAGAYADCDRNTVVDLGDITSDLIDTSVSYNSEDDLLFFVPDNMIDAFFHVPGLLAAAGVDDVRIVLSSLETNLCMELAAGAQQWVTKIDMGIDDLASYTVWDKVVFCGEYDRTSLIARMNRVQPMIPSYSYMIPYSPAERHDETFAENAEYARQVMENGGFDELLPVGTVIENLRASFINPDNGLELTADGNALDMGLAAYAASALIFETVMTSDTSNDLQGNTYRYDVEDTTEGSYTTPVNDFTSSVAVRAVLQAIDDPYNINNIPYQGPSEPEFGNEELDDLENPWKNQ